MKRLLSAALGCVMLLSVTACSSAEPAKDKVRVSVSFNALKEFTEAVGGTHVAVTVIIPDGTEPHDFEPKAQDLVALASADIFMYNGLGMEAWAEDAAQASGNTDLVTVVASDGVEAITNTDEGEIKDHGRYDPHVWLSLSGAKIEAANIRDALIRVDPANKTDYETNYTTFSDQIDTLLDEFQTKFNTVAQKDFVTGHAAFAYLCRDFGLQQNSVEDVFAEGEPSAKQLAALVEYCKDNHVTTIFAEEMASPAVSQTLADEIHAKVQTIYTMESNEDNKSYLERAAENLTNIYASLSAGS